MSIITKPNTNEYILGSAKGETMLDSIMSTIKKYNLLSQNDRVVVGVSGGPDSVALLHFLYAIRDKYDLSIHAAHINHMLRGKESDGDTQYVQDLCTRLGIPCSVIYANITSLSKDEGISLEEAGRKARYDFFIDTANKINATKIALAHNMNDQAETVLMRIMRGTGLDGLCGIKPIRDGLYIRPLIHTQRSDIERYCEINNLMPRIDSTNLKPLYTRNKIRLELIPYIKGNYNSNIEYTLSSMAEILSIDNDFINGYANNIFQNIAAYKEYEISLNIQAIMSLHDSIKKRILRKAVEKMKGNLTGIENKHIELMLNIMDRGLTGSAVELPGNLTAKVSYNNLIIVKSVDELAQKFCCDLIIPGVIHIPLIQGSMKSEIFNSDIDYLSSNRFVKYFDYDKIKGSLTIRSRMEGDYIIPLGMKGRKKIKELFIDSKIPRSERDKIPLVSFENEIIWVVGYNISDNYKIDKSTINILKLEFKRPGG